jgi:hypothetical protein
MKRIVRLTESDLTKIVRRVIRESKRSLLREGNGAAVAASFIKSLSGTFDDDEAAALRNIKLLKDRASLQEFSKTITARTGKGWCEYFNSEMSNVDEEYGDINDHIVSLGGSDCYKGSTMGSVKRELKKAFPNPFEQGSWGMKSGRPSGY